MVRSLGAYARNPAYGTGTYRRRIVLSRAGARLHAALLDDYHAMEMALTVRDGVISAVEAAMERYPKTTCPGAATALTALKGLPVADPSLRLKGVDRGGQCTHLVDMAALALLWLRDDGDRWVIEVALSDADADRRQDLSITVNGQRALRWALQDEAIVTPRSHAGRRFFSGYARWVEATFPPREGSLWMVAQMTVFVAQGRAFLVDGAHPGRPGMEVSRKGACYTFSDPAFAVAQDQVGFVRDWSNGLPPLAPTRDAAPSPEP